MGVVCLCGKHPVPNGSARCLAGEDTKKPRRMPGLYPHSKIFYAAPKMIIAVAAREYRKV